MLDMSYRVRNSVVSYRVRNLLIAAALAVCAVALMFIYASHAKSTATPAAGNATVYVAARDIPIGTTGAQLASGGWLVARKFAGNSVASGAVVSTATLSNLVAIQPTYAGEQIVARRFGTASQEGHPVRPEGQRACDGAPGRRAPAARRHAQAGQPRRRDRQRDDPRRQPDPHDGDRAAEPARPEGSVDSVVERDRPGSVGRPEGDRQAGPAPLLAAEERRLVAPAAPVDPRHRPEQHAGVGDLDRRGLQWHADRRLRVALAGDGEAASALREGLATLDGFELAELAGRDHAELLDVAVLVHEGESEPREELAQLREHTGAPVVLATTAPSSGLVRWALDAGIADVLPLPAGRESVLFVIEKAAQTARQAELGGDGRVVTVFSPKGGSGKSVVSTNLAVAAATHAGKKTLLIDLDLQFGDAAIMLGLAPDNTVRELLGTPTALDGEKLGVYTERHSSGVDVLPAPDEPGGCRARRRGGDSRSAPGRPRVLRSRGRRHGAVLLRPDARDARPDRPAACCSATRTCRR